MNTNICNMVSDRIIEQLNKGIIPWQKPWFTVGKGAISHSSGRPYSLLNQLMLDPGEYATFNQIKAEGGKVKKGAKSHPVVFWKMFQKEDTDENGEKVVKNIPVLKYYSVFNIETECEGMCRKYPEGVQVDNDPIADAESIIANYETAEGIAINRVLESDLAFYSPSGDYITVPHINQYKVVEEYYSTLFHEMTHSTGHKSRLNRFTGSAACAAFGSEEYSKEELTAEIGAAALVNHCGIESEKSFVNSAAYVQSWLRALKNDKTMIIAAAGKAEKAVEYILNCAPAI